MQVQCCAEFFSPLFRRDKKITRKLICVRPVGNHFPAPNCFFTVAFKFDNFFELNINVTKVVAEEFEAPLINARTTNTVVMI